MTSRTRLQKPHKRQNIVNHYGSTGVQMFRIIHSDQAHEAAIATTARSGALSTGPVGG